MKKLLGLLAMTSLVATSNTAVMACSSVKTLTLESEKSNKDLQESLKIKVKDGKLEVDYKEQDAIKEQDGQLGFQKKPGAALDKDITFDILKGYFTQTKDLKDDVEKKLKHEFLVKGKTGDTSIMLYLVQLDESNIKDNKGTIKVKILSKYKFTLEIYEGAKDLSKLTITLVEGQTKTFSEKLIDDTIKKFEPAATNRDYEITYDFGAVVGGKLVANKIVTINSNGDSNLLKGTKEIKIFELKDLLKLNINLVEGQTKIIAESSIDDAIKELEPAATNKDYEIVYGDGAVKDDKLVEGKIVTINSKTDSQLLKGTKEITIKKLKDLSELLLTLEADTDKDEAEKSIASVVKKFQPAATNKDYEIVYEDGAVKDDKLVEGKIVTINSKTDSQLLKGTKEIIIERKLKDLSELAITLVEGQTKIIAESSIDDAIKELEPVATTKDYEITYDSGALVGDKLVKGKGVTINSKVGSKLLKGIKKVTILELKDLKRLNIRLEEGTTKDDAEKLIDDTIKKFQPAATNKDYEIVYGDGAVKDDKLVSGKIVTINSKSDSKLLQGKKEITIL